MNSQDMKNNLKPIEHKFKALFFMVFKSFLKKGEKDFQSLDGNKIKKVLFLRPEKIGDMVVSFPVFDGLKQYYPHIEISILGSPKNYSIIKDDPRFTRIFIYKKNFVHDVKELLKMRRGNFDAVVDMICDDSVTALFLSQLCAPGKPRIGVGKVKFREYYDFNYDHRMNNKGHIIENTLKLLEAFNIDSSSVDGYAAPYLKNEDDQKAASFINQLTDDNSNILKIGYNLSAGAPTRIWAEQKAIQLIERILDSHPESLIILFTVPSERQRALELQQRLDGKVKLIPNNLSLTQAAAIIKYLDVLITPDTSLVHIARAFKVPVVGLYSRFMKNFLLWRPYGQQVGAVVSQNDDNIFDISVEQVYEAFVQVIKNRKIVKI
ncbi:MAG: glycosyltransferase family 9 protein [FCB group bacterium]|nr:glycosyltransferase family 9 protein [FCB group bacterium]